MSVQVYEKVFDLLFARFLSEYDHCPEQMEKSFHLIFLEILNHGMNGLLKYQDLLTPHHFQSVLDSLNDDLVYNQLRELLSSNRDLEFYNKYIIDAARRAQLNYEKRRLELEKGLPGFLKSGKFEQGALNIPPKQLSIFNDIISDLVNEEVIKEYYITLFRNPLFESLDQILDEFSNDYKTEDYLFGRIKQMNSDVLDIGPEAMQDLKTYLSPAHLKKLEEFISQDAYLLYRILKKNLAKSLLKSSEQKTIGVSPVSTKKIEERARIHKEMFEETALMPQCLKRSIIRLIYNMEVRILQNSPFLATRDSSNLDLDKEMKKEMQFLKQHSKAEGSSKKEALEAIKCFQGRADWEFILCDIEKLLKNIQILDFTKIRCLLKNSNETIAMVKNQHVIVFLGNSGAGKSTTIHFLAGSKMIQTKTDNIPTIQPISESDDPWLKRVTVSPLPISETRDIIPIEVKLESICHERGKIILLDTPGFEDTEGPEIEIANRIKLTNALRAAASVKIVLVHSSKNGERSTGIRKLAKNLNEILPSIEDYGSTFTHFFTKYSSKSEDQEAIIQELKSMHYGSEPKEFRNIISTMKRAACHFIEPLKPSLRLDLLRELAKLHNIIQYPEEAFIFKASSGSMVILENQLLAHQREIFFALNDATPDYPLIKYRLDELKFLADALQQSSIVGEKYDKCVDELRKKMAEICDNITFVFNEKFSKDGVSVDEEIKKYKSMQEVEELMKTHLREGLKPTHQLNLHFIGLSQNIKEKLCKCNRDEIFTQNMELNRLKRISNIFEDTSIFYQQSCEYLRTLIENSITALKDLIYKDEYEKLACEINQITRFKDQFQSHEWPKGIEKNFQNIKESLKSALNMPKELIVALDNKIVLITDDDISKLDQLFARLDFAMTSFEGTKLGEELANINNFWTQKIVTIFKNLTEEVKENFNKQRIEERFVRIESIVKCIISIHKISSIKPRISLEFSALKNAIRDQLTEIKSKIDLLLSQIFATNTIYQSGELVNYLRCLVSTKWVGELQLIDYHEIMRNITQSIASSFKSFEEQTVDIESHEYIGILSQSLHKKIEYEMPDLKAHFPEIVSIISQAEGSFFEKVNKEILSVHEKTGLNNSDPKSLKLKTCIKAINFLDACSTISALKAKSVEQKEILISGIKKGYITSRLAELESLNDSIIDSFEHKDKIVSEVAQFVRSFNEIIDIENSYPVIFSLFPNHKRIINCWKIRLSEQFDRFGTEMEQLLVKRNLSALKNRILIAKSLRMLDLYLTAQKSYQELGNQYNGKLASEIDQIKIQLEKSLQEFEYRLAADNFEDLESLGIKEVLYQNKCKNSLWELKELTRNSIVKFLTLTPEEGDSICKNLKNIENFFKYVGKYNQEEIAQEMIFSDIRIILSEKVKWFAEGINGLIHAHKFTEAENELCKINVIKQLFEKYLSSEAITLIEQLMTTKNEFVTKELVEDFSNVDKLPYIGDALRQVLNRLHEAKEKSTCNIYDQAYRDIQAKILSNFGDRLDKVSQTPQTLQKHLPKLKQALNALPLFLQRKLSEDIEDVLQKFTKYTEGSLIDELFHKDRSKCIEFRDEGHSLLLEKIDLRLRLIGDEGAKALSRNKSWINLSTLDLQVNNISDEGARALSENACWINLNWLDLSNNIIGEGGARKLSENKSWTNLQVLLLNVNSIGDRGARALNENTSWTHLSTLNLSCNNIGDEGAMALGENKSWRNLQSLGLDNNKICAKGVRELSAKSSWTNLKGLNLSYNNIGDEGARALSENESWVKISTLDLDKDNIGDEGARALSQNKTWSELTQLNLRFNIFGDEGARELTDRQKIFAHFKFYY